MAATITALLLCIGCGLSGASLFRDRREIGSALIGAGAAFFIAMWLPLIGRQW